MNLPSALALEARVVLSLEGTMKQSEVFKLPFCEGREAAIEVFRCPECGTHDQSGTDSSPRGGEKCAPSLICVIIYAAYCCKKRSLSS